MTRVQHRLTSLSHHFLACQGGEGDSKPTLQSQRTANTWYSPCHIVKAELPAQELFRLRAQTPESLNVKTSLAHSAALRSAPSASPPQFVRNAISQPCPNLLSQKLRFNKIPQVTICTVQFENHHIKRCQYYLSIWWI